MIPQMFPISMRQAGMLNDRINFTTIDNRLERVTVPTLVIVAKDDALVNPSHSLYAARNIPGAKLIELESGGHLVIGHPELSKTIVDFLRKYF